MMKNARCIVGGVLLSLFAGTAGADESCPDARAPCAEFHHDAKAHLYPLPTENIVRVRNGGLIDTVQLDNVRQLPRAPEALQASLRLSLCGRWPEVEIVQASWQTEDPRAADLGLSPGGIPLEDAELSVSFWKSGADSEIRRTVVFRATLPVRKAQGFFAVLSAVAPEEED